MSKTKITQEVKDSNLQLLYFSVENTDETNVSKLENSDGNIRCL